MRFAALAFVACAALYDCAGAASHTAATSAPQGTTALYDPHQLPAGAYGDLIRYGHDLIADTPKYAKRLVKADMSCQACHLGAGTVKNALLLGVAATFPQYNKRAHRFITLHDRIAECFLYSMNGTPPAYTSREMDAMVAYITWLSRGRALGAKPHIAGEITTVPQPASVSISAGAHLYTQRCAVCHQANGAGVSGHFPPLWGARSFNSGAGMHALPMMASFIKYNMPANAAGTLSPQEAYNVAAFVLSHDRPKLQGDRMIAFPPVPAKAF